MKKLRVINLFGGPGPGKSTLAAALFADLKMKGVNVELVTEFAKDLVWTERTKELKDQVYIFGKMYHKLWRLQGKVDVVICDSPLPLCIYYSNEDTPKQFGSLVMEAFDQFQNTNVVCERTFAYQQAGRYQDEEEANKVHADIVELINRGCIDAHYLQAGTMQQRIDWINLWYKLDENDENR